MSLNDFWDRAHRGLGQWAPKAANDFGFKFDEPELVEDSTSSAATGSSSLTGFCSSTSQCPSGYACVGGMCKFMSPNQTNSWQWNSPGSCQDQPIYNGNSGCNSGGPGSCQQTPNCGDIPQPKPEDCCGEVRCCIYGLTSLTVNCHCGPCVFLDQKKCSPFCDAYKEANGFSAIMGCNEENTCSDCEACDFFDEECRLANDAPCWCDHASCGDDCRKCVSDPSSFYFGGCVSAPPESCNVCTHVDSYTCPCGEVIGPITVCSKYDSDSDSGYDGDVVVTNLSATEVAESRCAPISDCGCGCECNCHSDCGPCEICAGDCTCAPDPACATP